MRKTAFLVFAALFVSALASAAESEKEASFVMLDESPVEIQKIGERCPVRVELPWPEVGVGGGEKVVGALARYVHCQGVQVSHLVVEAKKGPLDLVELIASAWVIAPKGRDTTALLEYEFVGADGESFRARQFLKLDEGEINWSDGGSIRVPGKTDLSTLRLRVTMTTPAPE